MGLSKKFGTRHGESFWKEDQEGNNKGSKLMKKMGWKIGNGLGANESGRKQFLRYIMSHFYHISKSYFYSVRKRKDNMGLGANANTPDEVFKGVTSMFDSLLKRLNKAQTPTESMQWESKTSKIPFFQIQSLILKMIAV